MPNFSANSSPVAGIASTISISSGVNNSRNKYGVTKRFIVILSKMPCAAS